MTPEIFTDPGCFCLRPFQWCFSLVTHMVASVSNATALEKPLWLSVFILILNLCFRLSSHAFLAATLAPQFGFSPIKHIRQNRMLLFSPAFPTSYLIFSPIVSLISVPQPPFCLFLFWSPKLMVWSFAKISFCPFLLICYINSYRYFFI